MELTQEDIKRRPVSIGSREQDCVDVCFLFLLGTKDITVSMTKLFSKKNRLSGHDEQKDKKIASKQIYVTWIVELANTFSILEYRIKSELGNISIFWLLSNVFL